LSQRNGFAGGKLGLMSEHDIKYRMGREVVMDE